MAAQYGIGVTRNRFELFDSDEDPIEVLKQHEILKEERKKTKVSTGKENSSCKDPLKTSQVKHQTGRISFSKEISNKTIDGSKTTKDSSKRFARTVVKPDVGTKSDKPSGNNYLSNKHFEVIHPENDSKFDVPILRDGNGRAARASNRGRGGGGRGFRQGFDNRGKREFDRQSGSDKTGVKHVDKKDGAGAFNWDSDKELSKEYLQGRNAGEEQWSPEKVTESEAEVVPPAENTEENPATNQDEAKEMTLDEWKALRVPKPKPVLNIRKAGEGEDMTRWKKMYALEKKNLEIEEEDEDYEPCDYPQRVGRQKHLLDIDIHYKDVRNNRGRVRGGAVRGPGRSVMRGGATSARGPGPKEVPKVDNEKEFPSLG